MKFRPLKVAVENRSGGHGRIENPPIAISNIRLLSTASNLPFHMSSARSGRSASIVRVLGVVGVLFFGSSAFGQTKWTQLPKAIGTATLTHGLYPEQFDVDTLRWIGGVLFNTVTKSVVLIDEERVGESWFGSKGPKKDDEMDGNTGTGVDFREHVQASRVGRWLALDPLAMKYPYLSPYSFTADNPILFIDPNGKEIKIHDIETGEVHTFHPGDPVPAGASSFVRDVYVSLQYLSRSETAQGVIQDLYADRQVVTIIKGDNPNETHYLDQTNTLTYYAMGGLQTDNGSQTPALGLIHELGHAQLDVKSPIKKFFLSLIRWPKYDDLNEKYVIKNIETPVVEELGETGTRKDHGGTGYYTQGPTSTAPAFFDTRPKTDHEIQEDRGRSRTKEETALPNEGSIDDEPRQ